MDSWEGFDETSLPDKKAFYFYSGLYVENITDADYRHARVFNKIAPKPPTIKI